MKIVLIGPGIIEIPSPGGGAIEILIWDYYQQLASKGHTVHILNDISPPYHQHDSKSPYCQKIIKEVNNGNYDVVHVHYDCMYHLLPFFTCKVKAITSHYPYIDQVKRHAGDGFSKIFKSMCDNKDHIIFCISEKDKREFEKYAANPHNMVEYSLN